MGFSRGDSSGSKKGADSKSASGEPSIFGKPGGVAGSSGAQSAFLGAGSKVEGKLVFAGPAILSGEVSGEVSAESTLEVGEAAVVNATIEGVEIAVRGTIHGDVKASSKIQLFRSAKVYGNIECGSIHIEDGAIFEGACKMLQRKPRSASPATNESTS